MADHVVSHPGLGPGRAGPGLRTSFQTLDDSEQEMSQDIKNDSR